MSARVDFIRIGYAGMVSQHTDQSTGGDKFMRGTGSCSLVRSGGLNVLFDTMGPWEKECLISGLASFKIHPDDISYLVCSHSHPDHIGNLNLFTKARQHFVGTSVYSQDVYDLNCFEPCGSASYKTKRGLEVVVPKYRNHQLDKNLAIEPTQGHTMECISMVAANCDNLGTVGLVGDLFERHEDLLDEGIWLGAGSQNADLQRANRSQIYNKVDYIVPGHGPLFRTINHEKPIVF